MAKTALPLAVRRRVDVEEGDPSIDDRYVVMLAPPPPQDSGTGVLLAGMLVGAVIGAAVGLFLAPRSGEETRWQVARRLPGGLGEAIADQAEAATETVKHSAPPPSNATPAALDPVAQVAQYQAPPVSTVVPSGTAATPPASSLTP